MLCCRNIEQAIQPGSLLTSQLYKLFCRASRVVLQGADSEFTLGGLPNCCTAVGLCPVND